MNLFQRLRLDAATNPTFTATAIQPVAAADAEPDTCPAGNAWLWELLGALETHRGVLNPNTPGLPTPTVQEQP